MMKIRCIEMKDMFEIRRIHNEHFKHEFELPDFTKFHCVYVVENDNKIVTVGGIRALAESVILTNKDLSAVTRVRGLLQMMNAQIYATREFGYDSLHCFIQDEKWEEHLKRVGFRHTKGDSFFLSI